MLGSPDPRHDQVVPCRYIKINKKRHLSLGQHLFDFESLESTGDKMFARQKGNTCKHKGLLSARRNLSPAALSKLSGLPP